MNYGFVRVCACTPSLSLSDPLQNAQSIVQDLLDIYEEGACVAVFPELCITGYSCADLFRQTRLLTLAQDALELIVAQTKDIPVLFAVGLPIRSGSALYNCAAVVCSGEILGFVPKQNISAFGASNERRYFTSGPRSGEIKFAGKMVPFGTQLIFSCISRPNLRIAVEISEDLYSPTPPSTQHAINGATLILNLAASSEQVTKADFRNSLVQFQSGKTICAYAYANAGFGESTTDMVFSGHNLIAENGILLGQTPLFSSDKLFCDVDTELLVQNRIRHSNFFSASAAQSLYRQIDFDLPYREIMLRRHFPHLPFVPSDLNELDQRCETILSIQANALAQRLRHTSICDIVIGLSGGLDSTLAFLVALRAFALLNLPVTGIHAITMPGFGTTEQTKSKAIELAKVYGVNLREIDIRRAVEQHFSDIGHDPNVHNITYENAQARERTQILMDIANSVHGLVLGTGDLSESALGWSTYNGDHMSMYSINCSVPKTLIRSLIQHFISKEGTKSDQILSEILKLPPSPELLPPQGDQITQITEDIIGPYELHDFFLYYFLRYGFSPRKIIYLATNAFTDRYDQDVITQWMKVFLKRFFSQQFKRSCVPDGPQIGSICLSPRTNWRMPSDASAQAWLNELDDTP